MKLSRAWVFPLTARKWSRRPTTKLFAYGTLQRVARSSDCPGTRTALLLRNSRPKVYAFSLHREIRALGSGKSHREESWFSCAGTHSSWLLRSSQPTEEM